MFLDDSGHSASFQDEQDFETGIRRVMQIQTAELEKMVNRHPRSLLLQTEIATRQVESLADTIHLAADATKSMSQGGDALNACNYARAGALEAYANVNRIVNGLGGAVGTSCGCVGGVCAGQAIPESCGYPHEGYQALASQEDQLWQAVKATTLRCKIIGDASVLASN